MDLRVAAKIGENRPLGRWNVISLDRQKRGCIGQDSSEPPVCSHFADRTNNFMNVVAPSLICACVPHVLWISRWFCQSYSWKIDFWTLKVIHQRMETAAAPYVSHLATSKRDISRHSSQSRRNAGENSKQLSLRRMTYVRDNHVYIRHYTTVTYQVRQQHETHRVIPETARVPRFLFKVRMPIKVVVVEVEVM